jgi:hypothetical protein
MHETVKKKSLYETIPVILEFKFLGSAESVPNEASITKSITPDIVNCFLLFFG